MFSERAKECLEEGNKKYKQGETKEAINFYTEGLQVNCKDIRLNAKLYSNRAAAYFHLGKNYFWKLLKSLHSRNNEIHNLYPFQTGFYPLLLSFLHFVHLSSPHKPNKIGKMNISCITNTRKCSLKKTILK